MAIANKYPPLRPSLLLDFAGSGTVDPRISFSRASSATYFDNKGVLSTAPAGVPRIDYDPVTGECRGLLIEEQRTNLLTYSEQFDNEAWVKASAGVTANATTAPDGTVTAFKVVENTSNTAHYVTQSTALSANKEYCLSAYLKAGEITRVDLQSGNVGSWTANRRTTFDLISGTVISGTAGEIEEVGNGWFRCRITAVFGPSSGTGGLNITAYKGGAAVYPGDGTSGFYVWGAQLEEGSFHTSYIPTTASQVTRAADMASMTGTNFSDWYSQDEGTLLIDYQLGLKLVGTRALSLRQSGTTSYIDAVAGAVTGPSGGYIHVVNDNVPQASIPSPATNIAYARYVNSFAYKENDLFGVRNGTVSAGNTSGVVPKVGTMYIGAAELNANLLCGHIRRIAYYPRRITNEQLQALSSI